MAKREEKIAPSMVKKKPRLFSVSSSPRRGMSHRQTGPILILPTPVHARLEKDVVLGDAQEVWKSVQGTLSKRSRARKITSNDSESLLPGPLGYGGRGLPVLLKRLEVLIAGRVGFMPTAP
jgi:hypothetical protein